MKKKLLIILACMVIIFGTCGCNKKVDNSISKTTEQEEKAKVKKLTQNDDLSSYLKNLNNKKYYNPLVTGSSKSNNYSGEVESHLLYIDENYIYDILVYSTEKDSITFENITEDRKENGKYEIKELKLESNDEEIYLKGINNENKEYILSYPYYSTFANSMHIQKTWTPTSYTNYDYYYSYDEALEVANERALAKTQEKNASSSTPTIDMTPSEVESSKWGKPDKINTTTYSWGTYEQWVYKNYGYVYFKNGKVTSVSER